MRFEIFDSLLPLSLLILHVQSRTCFAPDGVTIASADFQPCINIAGVESMCCGTNRTSNLDTCQPNGLCRNSGSNAHFRDYCTDSTWNSPNCLPKTTCADPAAKTDRGFIQMTQCTDFTWCCGIQNFTDCCNKGLGFTLADTLVTFNSPNATNTSPVSPATATVTFTPARGNEKKRAGVDSKIFIGVALGLGILILMGTAGGFWAGLRRGRGKILGVGDVGQWDHEVKSLQPHIREVGAQPSVAELGNGR